MLRPTSSGRAISLGDRAPEAVGALRLAIERGVDPPALLGAVAALQLELGDRDAARATIAELERDHPDHPRTALAIAQARLSDGKAAEAANELRVLVGAYESPEAHRLLALAELRSGNLEAAAAAIDRALELAPASVEAHRLRARIRYDAGQFGDALEEFQAVARLVRLSEEERLLVARCLYETGDLAAGRRVLQTLVSSEPPYLPANLELARREAKRDPEAATRALAQAEAAAPRAPAVLHQLTILDLRRARQRARSLGSTERRRPDL